MSDELKPCPFCGSEYTQVRYIGWKSPSAFDSGYRGECCDCGAITAAYPTEAEAIAAWNTRTERTCYPSENLYGFLMCCSECGRSLKDIGGALFSYCPNCGAKVAD